MNGAELVTGFFFFTIILLRINPSYFIILYYMLPSFSNVTAPVSVLSGTSETILMSSSAQLFLVPGTATWRVTGSHFGHLGLISHTEGRACRGSTTHRVDESLYFVWEGCTQSGKYFISIKMQKITNIVLDIIDLNWQKYLPNKLFFFGI